jgi:hypothetical protein
MTTMNISTLIISIQVNRDNYRMLRTFLLSLVPIGPVVSEKKLEM